jgi:peptidoglycan/xylan/chitin deacetylase (PgdA/CDA1 family)
MSQADIPGEKWPSQQTVYITVDFECDFGTALNENCYESIQEVESLISPLEQFDIPLTCFLQTEVLEEEPQTVKRLQNADIPVSFHPHSHTHTPRSKISVADEIEESTERYLEFFGRQPTGYRFPNGNIRDEDYEMLAANGYQFDASVFPSWRPGYFNNTRVETAPTYQAAHDIVELPFTVYSDIVRIPTALSYCQVLGRPYTTLLERFPPSVMVFNVHMHDLVEPSTIRKLPARYRAIYSRNADGSELFESILAALNQGGYSFDQLDDAHQALRDH